MSPTERPLAQYQKARVPILDQGREGACTGFGLATVIHYLLRTRRVVPDRTDVSPWMLYDMARRYDEWPGENYEVYDDDVKRMCVRVAPTRKTYYCVYYSRELRKQPLEFRLTINAFLNHRLRHRFH